MGQVISFEDRAVATLRARLGEAEGARDDLIAFARGHSGAVASIHQAVLAAIAAPELEDLLEVVTTVWPALLAIDTVVLALTIDGDGFIVSADNTLKIEARLIDETVNRFAPLTMRGVDRGHPLFGELAPRVKAEALIAIDCGPALPAGLLLLGQYAPLEFSSEHGTELLQFLGGSLAAMLMRWVTTPTD